MNRRPLIAFSAIVIVAMVILSVWAYGQLPPGAEVPVHWGPDGRPDGWAPAPVGLFLLPAITGGIAALFWALPVIEPRRANLQRSGRAYAATWVGVVTLMGVIHVLSVAAALGSTFDITRLVLIGTGVLFVVIGNYLPTVKSNYLMGIRTPWTLSSDLAWTRTHRLGGRLFVIEGIVLAALGLIGVSGTALLVAMLGGIGLMLVVVFVYSYQVWKTDPERRST